MEKSHPYLCVVLFNFKKENSHSTQSWVGGTGSQWL